MQTNKLLTYWIYDFYLRNVNENQYAVLEDVIQILKIKLNNIPKTFLIILGNIKCFCCASFSNVYA